MDLRFVVVKVKDLERAKKFYRRLIGEEPVKEEGDRMVEFEFEGVKLGLYNPAADGQSSEEKSFGDNCIPAFGVEDIELELERVSDFAEIVSHEEKKGHEWFTFKDTEGNTLEIHRK